jgi:flagella basal body P-ring formation protein FlgA
MMMTALEIQETRQSVFTMCLMTLRGIILTMVLGFGLLLAVLTIGTADAATLKSISTVNDDVIRLGDIFEGVSDNGNVVLGRAPLPGSDMILSARTLMRISSTYGVDWKAQSVADQTIVRRESHTVSPLDIQDAVKLALARRGVDGSYTVVLNNLNTAVTLPRNIPATAEVTNLNYTPGRDGFTATLASPSADNPLKTISVSGILQQTIQIPVLKASLRKGDIIGSTDIEWIDTVRSGLMQDTIVDADELIGKTPVRILSLGQPIRMRDIEKPQLVARGDDITIIFQYDGMQLTAKGKAMQNGAEGDLIRAVNVSSNRSVTAKITGDRVVTVQ